MRHSQKMESVGQLAPAWPTTSTMCSRSSKATPTAAGEEQFTGRLSASLERISSAADRAANLTRQLLTFSRRQVMQPQVLDLNEVIRNVARMLERTIGENIAIRLDAASTSLRFMPTPECSNKPS